MNPESQPPVVVPGPRRGAAWWMILGLMLAAPVLCLVEARVLPDNAAAPVVILTAILGSLACGLAAGFLLAFRWTETRGPRIALGLVLGLVCTGACFVASFAGCALGLELH